MRSHRVMFDRYESKAKRTSSSSRLAPSRPTSRLSSRPSHPELRRNAAKVATSIHGSDKGKNEVRLPDIASRQHSSRKTATNHRTPRRPKATESSELPVLSVRRKQKKDKKKAKVEAGQKRNKTQCILPNFVPERDGFFDDSPNSNALDKMMTTHVVSDLTINVAQKSYTQTTTCAGEQLQLTAAKLFNAQKSAARRLTNATEKLAEAKVSGSALALANKKKQELVLMNVALKIQQQQMNKTTLGRLALKLNSPHKHVQRWSTLRVANKVAHRAQQETRDNNPNEASTKDNELQERAEDSDKEQEASELGNAIRALENAPLIPKHSGHGRTRRSQSHLAPPRQLHNENLGTFQRYSGTDDQIDENDEYERALASPELFFYKPPPSSDSLDSLSASSAERQDLLDASVQQSGKRTRRSFFELYKSDSLTNSGVPRLLASRGRIAYLDCVKQARLNPWPILTTQHFKLDSTAGVEAKRTKGSLLGTQRSVADDGEEAMQVVNFNNYNMGDERIQALAEFLSESKFTVSALLLKNNGILECGLRAVLRLIGGNSKGETSSNITIPQTPVPVLQFAGLHSLDLSNNDVAAQRFASRGKVDCYSALFNALHTESPPLTELNLAHNGLGDTTVTALCSAVRTNATLTKLGLGGNGIEKSGGALGDCLERNIRLTELDLSWNMLCKHEACKFAKGAGANSTLRCLGLAHNSMGNGSGASVLAQALYENDSLQELDLSYNHIGQDGCLVLAHLLERNQSLRNLQINGNPVGAVGCRALIRAVAKGEYRAIGIEDCNFEHPFGASTFDRQSPNGSYLLDLEAAYDRVVAETLLELAYHNAEKWGQECWRDVTLDGKPLQVQFLDEKQLKPRHTVFQLSSTLLSRFGDDLGEESESEDEQRGPKVIGDEQTDATTVGKWQLPEAGHLRLRFESNVLMSESIDNQHLARIQQQFKGNTRASVIKGVAMETQRSAVTKAMAQMFAFDGAQAGQILSDFTGSTAKVDAALQVYTQIADTHDTEDVLDQLNTLERMQLKHALGLFFFFNSHNPTGHYKLNLGLTTDSMLAKRLFALNRHEKRERRRRGMPDLSQHGNHSNIRNETLNGEKFRYSDEVILPDVGLIEFDYVSPTQPPPNARPLTDRQFEKFVGQWIHLDLLPEITVYELSEIYRSFSGEGAGDNKLSRESSNDRDSKAPTVTLSGVSFAEHTNDTAEQNEHPKATDPIPSSITDDGVDSSKQGKVVVKIEVENINSEETESSRTDPGVMRPEVQSSLRGQSRKVRRKDLRAMFRALRGSKPGVKRGRSRGKGPRPTQRVEAYVQQDESSEVTFEEFVMLWKEACRDEQMESRVLEIKRASSRCYFTSEQVRAMILLFELSRDRIQLFVLMWSRVVDKQNLERASSVLTSEEYQAVFQCLGPIALFNPLDVEGKWILDLSYHENRVVVHLLTQLEIMEPGHNWREPKLNGISFGLNQTWVKAPPRSGVLELEYRANAPQSNFRRRAAHEVLGWPNGERSTIILRRTLFQQLET